MTILSSNSLSSHIPCCSGSPLISLTAPSEHPSWNLLPLPVLLNYSRQCEFSLSSFSLLPSMVAIIICGLYLQPRSLFRDSEIYIQLLSGYLSLDSHRHLNNNKTNWNSLSEEIIFFFQMPHLCFGTYHPSQYPIQKPECHPQLCFLSLTLYFQFTNSHPFCILNIYQIYSLLSLSTVTTHI